MRWLPSIFAVALGLASAVACSSFSADAPVDGMGADAATDAGAGDASFSCATVAADPNVIFCEDFDGAEQTTPFGFGTVTEDVGGLDGSTATVTLSPGSTGQALRTHVVGNNATAYVSKDFVPLDALTVDVDIDVVTTTRFYMQIALLVLVGGVPPATYNHAYGVTVRGNVIVEPPYGAVTKGPLGAGLHHLQIVVAKVPSGWDEKTLLDGRLIDERQEPQELVGVTNLRIGAFTGDVADGGTSVPEEDLRFDNIVVRKN